MNEVDQGVGRRYLRAPVGGHCRLPFLNLLPLPSSVAIHLKNLSTGRFQ